MAKKRKPAVSTPSVMDLDHPPLQPPNSILSANTNAGVSKPTKSARLPRGKGRRAQRLRKEKASERAEEVRGRTERKVERSKGRGNRRGERNAAWEEMNARIKGALVAEKVAEKVVEKGKAEVKVGGENKHEDEEEWIDEDAEIGMVDIEEGGKSVEALVDKDSAKVAVRAGETPAVEVDKGILWKPDVRLRGTK